MPVGLALRGVKRQNRFASRGRHGTAGDADPVEALGTARLL
jgi:hypothetical protein